MSLVTPPPAAEIVDRDLEEIAAESYLGYAAHVITDRSIPSALDGFKSSGRSALWAAFDKGLVPTKDHQKLMAWVGHGTGTFYPYGDGAFEGVISSLEAWHLMNVRFIDGSGNWSGPDNKSSAPRYIDARLSPAGLAAVETVNENAVPMMLNYNGTETQPTLLPVTWPNALTNPSTGIAVGLAAKIPSFNLGELAAVTEHLLRNKREIDLPTLTKLLPAPDFPTKANVYWSEDDRRSIYFDGFGKIVEFAAYEADVTKKATVLKFTALPFDVSEEQVIRAINTLIEEGSSSIVSARSLGMGEEMKRRKSRKSKKKMERRSEVEVIARKGTDPDMLAGLLYQTTPLSSVFHANMNALVGEEPRQMGVVEMLNVWLDFRFETVVCIRQFRLDKAQARLHIVNGMLKVIVDIDEAIKIIRKSDSAEEARSKLMKRFKVDETQANYVLDRTLRSLTRANSIELEQERDDLESTCQKLEAILKSKAKQRDVILKELDEAVQQFGWARRSTVLSHPPAMGSMPKAVSQATSSDNSEASSVGSVGLLSNGSFVADPKPGSPCVVRLSGAKAFGFSDTGAVAAFPLGSLVDRPEPFGFGSKSLVAACGEFESIVVVTANGKAKRVASEEVEKALTKRSPSIMKLADGDRVVAVHPFVASGSLMVVSSDGMAMRCKLDDIPEQGHGAGGVAGMKLSGSAKVVGAFVLTSIADDTDTLAVITSAGVKVTALSEFSVKGRATAGLRIGKGECVVKAAAAGPKVVGAAGSRKKTLPEVSPRGKPFEENGTKALGYLG